MLSQPSHASSPPKKHKLGRPSEASGAQSKPKQIPFYGVIDNVTSFNGDMEGPYDFGFAISITIDRQTYKGVIFRNDAKTPMFGEDPAHMAATLTAAPNLSILGGMPMPHTSLSSSSSSLSSLSSSSSSLSSSIPSTHSYHTPIVPLAPVTTPHNFNTPQNLSDDDEDDSSAQLLSNVSKPTPHEEAITKDQRGTPAPAAPAPSPMATPSYSVNLGDFAPPPAPRGRGRPRKHPIPATPADVSTFEFVPIPPTTTGPASGPASGSGSGPGYAHFQPPAVHFPSVTPSHSETAPDTLPPQPQLQRQRQRQKKRQERKMLESPTMPHVGPLAIPAAQEAPREPIVPDNNLASLGRQALNRLSEIRRT